MLLRRALLCAVTALALPLAASAQTPPPTVDAGGAKFETTAEVAGQKLVLNGTGVRYRAIFKVYGAGLYLPSKTDNAEAALKMAGPKRIMLKLLRDVDGKDLGKAFTDSMEKNLIPEERARTITGIFKFGQIFGEIKRAPSGAVIHVDWVPGSGAHVYYEGKLTTEPIKEVEFFNAVLRIWLGEKPVEDKLKVGLLGQSGR